MAENKTHKTDVPVEFYLSTVEPERRRREGERLHELMSDVTGDPGVMWGPTMIGYGDMHYLSRAGREGDWFKVGFSPRKAKLSLYGLKDTPEQLALLPELGPHSVGAGCVYANRLDALDEDVLRRLVALAYAQPDSILYG